MKNLYTVALLSAMLAGGVSGLFAATHNDSMQSNNTPSTGIYTWKIKNKTGGEIVLDSDRETKTLQNKEKVDLKHSGPELMINGKEFTTTDQVIVVYKKNNGDIAIETSPRWDDQVRYHFGRFKKEWNYDTGFRDKVRTQPKNPEPATIG